jgi:hypothetical protein
METVLCATGSTVAYGANSVEVTPTLISVSLVLAPLPDYILHNVTSI